MTEQQAAAAQARLDACAEKAKLGWEKPWAGEPLFEESINDYGQSYFGPRSSESVFNPAIFGFLEQAPNDLRLALAAIRRVRNLKPREGLLTGADERDRWDEYVRWGDVFAALNGEADDTSAP